MNRHESGRARTGGAPEGFVRRLRIIAAAGLLWGAAATEAAAQQPPAALSPAADPSAWRFNIAPYLWLPEISTGLRFDLPAALGGRLTTTASSSPGDYLPGLNFAAMFSAEARRGRFSVLTDLLFMDVGAKETDIRSLDFFGLPSHPISRSLQTGSGTVLRTTIWTLAGGYTALQGDWGHLDVIAGFRLADVEARTDYRLQLNVAGPRGNGASFGGSGRISTRTDIWNGIAGFRGSLNLGQTGFFMPYYFDIGTGGSDLTWQATAGIGYRMGRVSMSALYRHLSFEQSSRSTVQSLSLGGPMFAVNVTF
ncbi:hypothetical protein [Roseococcus pinisoli]|uniref:Uncharacterized protein n=1 Tax=Roseococcus pinisoli TaxID=2835040 RepID=A0ABS5QJB9_9PROT|nr:hypothetical protein [Roseococcus pinisoli]MBS7813779.1 hypothetical protein [Roseococcus pinisoli]